MALLRFIIIFTIAVLPLSCSCQKKGGGGSNGDPIFKKKGDSAPTNKTKVNAKVEDAEAVYLTDKPLNIQTPEQFSLTVEQALGYKSKTKLGQGATYDSIVRSYGVALGGLDFVGARARDLTPTVQALLTMRVLAFRVAADTISKEASRQKKKNSGAASLADYTNAIDAKTPSDNEPFVFVKSNVLTDRPVITEDQKQSRETQNKLRAGEERWFEQLDEIYLRLLARKATTKERDDMKSLFTTSFKADNSVANAWTMVLYTLLSTMEFWNL